MMATLFTFRPFCLRKTSPLFSLVKRLDRRQCQFERGKEFPPLFVVTLRPSSPHLVTLWPSSPHRVTLWPSSPHRVTLWPSSPHRVTMWPSSPHRVTLWPSSPHRITLWPSSPHLGTLLPACSITHLCVLTYDIWYDIFNCNWVATRWQ
jgi:hypothetical protein